MPVKASKKLNRIFDTCSADTLPPKTTHLITLAAQLARCDASQARESLSLAREAGASFEEIRCAACHSACTSGLTSQSAFVSLLGETAGREPFARVQAQALDAKTDHLVALAACLASGCDCAAGHIVEARRAGVSEEELARAACIASCVTGRVSHWRFGAALQCAEGKKACVC